MPTKRLDPASKQCKIMLTEDQKLVQDLKELWQTSQAPAPDAPTNIQWSKDDQSLPNDVDHITESPLYDIAKDEDFNPAYESVLQTKIAAVTAMMEKEKPETEKTHAIASQDDCQARLTQITARYAAKSKAYVEALKRTTETNQLYQNRLELYGKGFQILHDEHEMLSNARTSDLDGMDEIEAEYQQDERRFQEAVEQWRRQQEIERNQTVEMADGSTTMEAESRDGAAG